MRSLCRRRLDHDVFEMPEAAPVRKPLTRRPGAYHHFKRFLEARFGLLRRDLKTFEFAVAVAFANAEIEPTGGKKVERGRLLCEQNRIVPWRHDDSGAQPQCRRAHCQGSKQHQRGGNLVPTAEMMLHRKARMKPERLCFDIEIKEFEKAAAGLRTEAWNIGFGRTEQTEPHV